MKHVIIELRTFFYEKLNFAPKVHEHFAKAERILDAPWQAFLADTDRFFAKVWPGCPPALHAEPELALCDYLATMTDHYALRQWEEMFVPRRWELM